MDHLVIDDEPLVLEVIADELEAVGYNTRRAREGVEAIEEVEGAGWIWCWRT
jgi:CheY-like chemotaxis protein